MALLSRSSRQWGMFSRGRWVCALLVLLALSGAGQTPNLEYRIKAAYLFNFAKFVSWPAPMFPSSNSAIVIGIVGKDPFGAELDDTIAGKNIESRPLEIRRLNEADRMDGCHIVFVSESERKRLPQILGNVRGKPVLTVSDMEEFTNVGGMIRFFRQENNVRFEVDLDAVEAGRLRISSKVLRVAIVKSKTRR